MSSPAAALAASHHPLQIDLQNLQYANRSKRWCPAGENIRVFVPFFRRAGQTSVFVAGGAVRKLLAETAERAARYVEGIGHRRVAPLPADVTRLEALGGPLPESPSDPAQVLALLDDIGSPATVATTGGRYFGFVIGGTLPAALAANWLAGAWDQNAAMQIMAPGAAEIEEIVREWTLDLLGLPSSSAAGFVTCTTMANFSGLAAARSALLQRSGWNVEEDGLFDAPPFRVVVGHEVHVSVLRALTMLGLGRSR